MCQKIASEQKLKIMLVTMLVAQLINVELSVEIKQEVEERKDNIELKPTTTNPY